MTRSLASLSIALAAAGTGCMAGHAASTQAPTTSSQPRMAPEATGGMSMQACPMAVPGTQVVVADTLDGESITFTTSPVQAADLRARVRAMADTHNQHHQGGMETMPGGMQHGGMMMGGGSMGSGGGADGIGMMPPPSRARVEEVDGGARVVVTPNALATLYQLRSAVRMHAEHMRESGRCDMGPAQHGM